MTPIRLSDEALSSLLALATPLAVGDRDQFLKAVFDRLASVPPDQRGDGLIHRFGIEEQHRLLIPPGDFAGPPSRWSRRHGAAKFG